MTAENDRPISASWRDHARRDWHRVRVMRHAGDLEGAALFLQQSLEKYLKGFLLDRGWRLRKTHVLNLLLDKTVAHRPDLAAYRALCERVSGYYLVDRYPGEMISSVTSDQVAADAQEAMALIRSLFPDEQLEPLSPTEHSETG